MTGKLVLFKATSSLEKGENQRSVFYERGSSLRDRMSANRSKDKLTILSKEIRDKLRLADGGTAAAVSIFMVSTDAK